MIRRLAVLLTTVALTLPTAGTAEESPERMGQPATEFQGRRRALLKKVEEAEAEWLKAERERNPRAWPRTPIIVLRGADEREIESKFRQSNDFAYLTGVDVPSAYLVLGPEEGDETLYLPPTSPHGENLMAARPGPGEASARALGFQRVESTGRFLADVFEAIGDPIKRSWGPGRRVVVYTEGAEARVGLASTDAILARFLQEGAPNTDFEDIAPSLHELRVVKSPAELALMRKAIAITAEAQRAVREAIRPGLKEYELEGLIAGAFVGGGSPRPAFPSIVGAGPNATVPHYFANRREVGPGDLVVVDIGAEWENYAADITRTYPASGRFSDRQRAVYQLVLDAQKAAEAMFRPGETSMEQMHEAVVAFFKASDLRAKDRGGRERTMERFFIHGLGHYVGLDVHDVGPHDEPVPVGAVITIEPGLYIPSEEIGVRIEDDYLVTESGLEKLSAAIPSAAGEVERAGPGATAGGEAGGR